MKLKNGISEKGIGVLVKNALISVAIGAVICALLLLTCSAASLKLPHPQSLLWAGRVTLILGGGACGLSCALLHGERCILCGILSGTVYVGIILALRAIFVPEGEINTVSLASALAVCMVCAYLGCTGRRGGKNTVRASSPMMKKRKKSAYYSGLNK